MNCTIDMDKKYVESYACISAAVSVDLRLGPAESAAWFITTSSLPSSLLLLLLLFCLPSLS